MADLINSGQVRLYDEFAGARIDLSETDGAAALSPRSQRGGASTILTRYGTQQGPDVASLPVRQGLGGGRAMCVRYAASSVIHGTSAVRKEWKGEVIQDYETIALPAKKG
jgi:hypothetical protein